VKGIEMSGNPIAVEAFATMERHVAQVAVELFAGYGIAVHHSGSGAEAGAAPLEASVAAIIGYAGDKVRGALILVASRRAIESWRLALDLPDTDGDACDTLGEFSNMLLGRLKGRLLPEGFPILLSTPTTAFGSGFTLARPAGPSQWLTFDGPGWRLDVRINATFDAGFALQVREDRGAAADAGDMVLF
jgi:CheY-specific phosphatase CheX